jgi:uncharacterized membrane protein
MNRLLRDLGLILALAALWAISGYAIGAAIEIITTEILGLDPYPLGVIMASINVIIGLLLFKGITRDPTAERIFFEGPGNGGEGDIRVGCLWVMPATLLLYGLLLWFVALLFRFFLPK